jgi:hypothetical protein
MDSADTSARDVRSETLAGAAQAIALCCRGDVEQGLARYRAILGAMRDDLVKLPVGLHLKLLRDAGLDAAAAAIRDDALAEGQNLNVGLFAGKPPAEIAAEYRALFAQGVINAAMVAHHLVVLSKLGDTAALAPFLDADRLVRQTVVTPPADDPAGGRYWEEVAAALLAQRSDANWQDNVQSVRGMHYVRLADHPDGRIRALTVALREQAARYLAGLRDSDLPIRAMIPGEFRIAAWALISDGRGFNVPHIHPKGCATGVVYIAAPDEAGADGHPAGSLRIGPPRRVEITAGWPDLVIAPRPGTLVLMPSYFTHWTTPLGKPGLRISIAFDILGRSGAPAPFNRR